ncbi:MAG: hypothetical protein AAGF23_07980 [Acidobacteriota bacterium]
MRKELERQAARRIHYFSSTEAGKVLGHPRYWTLPFLVRYLDKAAAATLEDPEEGFLFAVHGPELARRVPMDPASGYGDDARRRSFIVLALGLLGDAARRSGRLGKAEACFLEGRLLLEDEWVAGPVAGFLWRLLEFDLESKRPTAEVVRIVSDLPADDVDPADVGRLFLVRSKIGLAAGGDVGPLLVGALTAAGAGRGSRYERLREDLFSLALAAVRGGQTRGIADHGLVAAVSRLRKRSGPAFSRRHRVMLLWIEGYAHSVQGLSRFGIRLLRRASRQLDVLDAGEQGELRSDLAAALARESEV